MHPESTPFRWRKWWEIRRMSPDERTAYKLEEQAEWARIEARPLPRRSIVDELEEQWNSPEAAQERRREQQRAARRKKSRLKREARLREISASNSRRRTARMAAAPVRDLSKTDWEAIKVKWHYRCAYCGTTPAVLTMDHVQPIVQGGSHTAANIVPACKPCNSRKGHRPAPAFLNPPP